MDTSETYIKMCEKAEEIQKLRKQSFGERWESGDYFTKVEETYHGWKFLFSEELFNQSQYYQTYGRSWGNHVWLPRQDQLQEMVWVNFTKKRGIKACTVHMKLIDLAGWIADFLKRNYSWQPESMEQLWLAYVMKEKYGKVWNGEEWVKQPLK